VYPAIVSLIAVTAVAGAAVILVLSARLRREIADLFRSFDRAERALVPVVAIVRTDRDRLTARLARLTEPEDGPTRR
jgi:hypothetical protein